MRQRHCKVENGTMGSMRKSQAPQAPLHNTSHGNLCLTIKYTQFLKCSISLAAQNLGNLRSSGYELSLEWLGSHVLALCIGEDV